MKNKDKKKFVRNLGALILAAVLLAICITVLVDPFHWFTKPDNKTETVPSVTNEVENLASNKIYLMSSQLVIPLKHN